MSKLYKTVVFFSTSLLLVGCQGIDSISKTDGPQSILNFSKKLIGPEAQSDDDHVASKLSISDILEGPIAKGELSKDFPTAMRSVLDEDPLILSRLRTAEARLASVDLSRAQKEFQVAGTIYGGIEDVTDETTGVAFSLSATRIISDGGILDATIRAKVFSAESALQDFRVTQEDRAYALGSIWIELEKYQALKNLIDSRLDVLDPLIEQLEQVADAGLGDVSSVAAAQRTVATIKLSAANISEGLAQAELNYINAFGSLPSNLPYDAGYISENVPNTVSEEMVRKAPMILSKYATYQATLENVLAAHAKDKFNIGFEARAMRPFAGSEYDSDESIGLVARKTLFSGGIYELEIKEAEALVNDSTEQIRAAYREGERVIRTAQQNITAMDRAIKLSRNNSEVTKDEITYLRQQLIIGGSTLDSVLSAEARLYEAENKETSFIAERRRSELLIMATLGLLGNLLDLQRIE